MNRAYIVKWKWFVELVRVFTRRKTKYVTIVEWIFYSEKPSLIKQHHEIIHIHQGRELLYVFFWLFYIIFYVIGLIKYRNMEKAYLNIPFEKEARGNELKMDYLFKRKPFAWVDYV